MVLAELVISSMLGAAQDCHACQDVQQRCLHRMAACVKIRGKVACDGGLLEARICSEGLCMQIFIPSVQIAAHSS